MRISLNDASGHGSPASLGRALMVLALSCGVFGLAACDGGEGPQDSATPAASSALNPGAPNVLMITFESLRTDRVGFLGGKSGSRPGVPLTPNLDALATESMVYPDAHSVTSWTLASHASLFTGLYPMTHQTQQATHKLDDSYETLAERLAERGYETGGVVSGPYLRPTHNLNQGFQFYDFKGSNTDHNAAHSDITNPFMEDSTKRFLEEERDPSKPFFLFGYWWDPHYDFLPPTPYDSMYRNGEEVEVDLNGFGSQPTINKNIKPAELAYVYSQYEGEIRWTDEHLGRVFDLLKQMGVWDNTMVILTADHGEEFFDHGEKGHFNNIYSETVRVPLIIKYPKGGPVGVDDRLVSLVDVVPTVLEAAGIPEDPSLDGVSMLSPNPAPDREIFYELFSVWHLFDPRVGPRSSKTKTKSWLGVRAGDHKLVVHIEAKQAALFNVREDPKEQRDLKPEQQKLAHEMAKRIDAWQKRSKQKARKFTQGGDAELDEAERERLRALGYLRE